jgi:class 3 adenylate cyclase
MASLTVRAIVCTDIVGSTAIRSRIGDHRADLLRQDHDEIMGGAVAAHRGRVLHWTGDGVQCEFATASAAIAAAIDMQRAVRRYARSPDAVAAFEVRIGVAVGEVTVDADDAHGVAVIEAVRLEAQAAPGEILATDLVERLGRRRSDAAFEVVGERRLKGLDGPVQVLRIVDTAASSQLHALPKALMIDRRFPLVGRDVPLAEALQSWREVRSGASRTVLISGPPGVGKSRLVAQLVDRAHGDGAVVLAGACDSDFVVPYQPFAAALREVETDDVIRALTDGDGPLGPLFAARRGSVDELGAGDRLELFDEIGTLLERLAGERPVVLVLEDLHWADAPTVQLLRFVLQQTTSTPLLVVATFRGDEIDGTHPLHRILAEAHLLRRVRSLSLGPIGEADVAEMVTARVPGASLDAVRRFARRLHTESAGSPFFVCELLHHLSSTGQLAPMLATAGAERLPIPASVRDVVTQRLAQLPGSCAEVLERAALIGLTFDLDLLAAVTAKPLDAVLQAIEDAGRTAIVQEIGPSRFSFSHAIVRSTLHDRLSATRRALGHRTVAESIEALGRPHHAELAHHWAEAGDHDRAVTHLEAAAREALAALAYESAAERFTAVLDHVRSTRPGDAHALARALLGLGLAQRGLGKTSYLALVDEAGRLARRLRDPDLIADAALASIWPGNYYIKAGQTEQQFVELCHDALSVIDDDPRRIRVLGILASHLTFDPDRPRRVATLETASAAARAIGDPELIGSTLLSEYVSMWDPSTTARRAQIAIELGRMARASGDPGLAFFSSFFLAVADTERGRLAEARGGLVQLLGTLHAERSFYERFQAERLLLSIDLYTGKADVQRDIDALAARYAHTHADTDGTWALQTAGLALQHGTLSTMADGMKAVIDASPIAPNWMPAYGLALLGRGDRAGAAAVLDGFDVPHLDCFWLSTLQSAAELAVGLGRLDWCERIHGLLEPYADQVGVASHGTLLFGLVSTTLASLRLALGDLDGATGLLPDSMRRADAMGAAYERTVTRRLLVEAMTRSRPPGSEVARLRTEALALAERHGFSRERRLLEHGLVDPPA